jgi:prepilin-type N-terminal cleavage/methylation domain-containing protein
MILVRRNPVAEQPVCRGPVTPQPARSGFTLLEVLLASAITVVLLFGLYMIMKMQFTEAQASRAVVERATVVRGVINRLTIDLATCPSPNTPFTQLLAASQTGSYPSSTPSGSGGGSASGSGSGTASGSGSGGSGGGGTGSSSGSGSGSGSGSSSSTNSTTTPPNDNPTPTISYFAGVIGNTSASGGTTPSSGPSSSPDQLTIWVARVPDYVDILNGDSSGTAAPVPSDIRRIDYWFVPDQGLCRYESMWVSSDDVSSVYGTPGSVPSNCTIAPEVTSVMFEYWDPTNLVWQSQWDGSVVGPDGLTPTGPPGAIRVTLTMKAGPGESGDKQYVQVIPIPTSPGTQTPPTTTTTTTNP